MRDGKLWMTANLNTETTDSYCPKLDQKLCDQYGRLYSWEAAKKACDFFGDGWHLPTNDEWMLMAKHYGGIVGDSEDNGKSAYKNLIKGGPSGFDAVLGGNREVNGSFERIGAHGFYWTATDQDSTDAWFYNFGNGSELLNRHTGDKQRAISVRCVKTPN